MSNYFSYFFIDNYEKIIGFIHFFIIEEDNYLQVTSFSIKHEVGDALNDLLQLFDKGFSNYQRYFGFSYTHQCVNLLKDKKYEVIDDIYDNMLILKKMRLTNC